jgi:hypothetical protein
MSSWILRARDVCGLGRARPYRQVFGVRSGDPLVVSLASLYRVRVGTSFENNIVLLRQAFVDVGSNPEAFANLQGLCHYPEAGPVGWRPRSHLNVLLGQPRQLCFDRVFFIVLRTD